MFRSDSTAQNGAFTTATQDDVFWRSLVRAASEPYRATDAHAHRFVRAKLGGDRVFRHVIESGLIPPGARVLDIGCGQGLVAGLVRAAGDASRSGRWPAAWAQAPDGAHVTGIDPLTKDIARAATALGDAATFIRADMRSIVFPRCDVIVFFDTLHYIAPAEQDDVLRRARDALRPGGVLLLRVGDASARGRFVLGQWIDRFTMLLHGGGFGRLSGRPKTDWTSTLEQLGLQVASCQMNGRPPFANLLIVARSNQSSFAPDTFTSRSHTGSSRL